MNLKEIVDELVNLKISVRLADGELKVSGPRESITPELIRKIRDNKDMLIGYFKTPPTAPEVAMAASGREAGISAAGRLLRPLDFSIFYFGNAVGGAAMEKNIYRLLMDGARYADKNGYAAVWVPERHFDVFGGLYPSPSVLGGALAAVTVNIGIRAGSVVVPLHNPIRIAEEWSVIDNLSGGRVGIACASGWQPNDFVLHPENYGRRHEVLYQTIDTIRRLWKGEAVHLKDGKGVVKDTRIYPAPVQKELPIWVTSGGNIETFISAGKLGLNVLTHLLGETVEELEVKIKAYRRAYHEAGHDERNAKVALMLHTYIGEEVDRTHEEVRIPFVSYLRSSLGLIRNNAISMGFDLGAENFSDKDIEGMLEYSYKRYITHSSLIGTKDSCRNMLYRLSDIGVSEIACLIDFGVDHSAVMASLERLTELKEQYNAEQTTLSAG